MSIDLVFCDYYKFRSGDYIEKCFLNSDPALVIPSPEREVLFPGNTSRKSFSAEQVFHQGS
jgi:hypothetical protein